MKDSKYRGDWHVVQRIIPRGIYDIPTQLKMDKKLDLYKEKAFQEKEQILAKFLVDEDL